MTKHYGHEDKTKGVLRLDFWLTIARGPIVRGYRTHPSVKASAGQPNLSRDARAMRLKMTLPLSLFEQPLLAASITVDSPAQAVEIDASAVAEAVRQVVGVDVDVQVVRPEEE